MHCELLHTVSQKNARAVLRRRATTRATTTSTTPAPKPSAQATKPVQRASGLHNSHVTYTTRKADVDVTQLHALLSLSSEVHCGSNGPLAEQLFAHWDEPVCDEALARLKSGIDASVAVAAAYTSKHRLGLPDSTPPSGGSIWEWPTAAAASRQLVGFARASSDRALVATIHDVVVHPAVERRGVARRLVGALVRAVQQQGISDIGCCTPASCTGFFQACSFDLDREGALPMVLTEQAAQDLLEAPAAGAPEDRPLLQHNPQLQRSLLEALDQRQAPGGRRVGFRW